MLLLRASLLPALLVSGACSMEAPDDLGFGSEPVIGGEVTPEGMYPATGALVYQGQVGCTGTLIRPDVVLTAAHCLDSTLVGPGMPGFTLKHDGRSLEPADVVAGQEKIIHEEFDIFANIGSGVGTFYDIGLLILVDEVDGVEPELLPSASDVDEVLEEGATVLLVGYGLSDPDGNELGVKLHGEATLREVGESELLIAIAGEQQNCNGDSGGPGFIELGDGSRRVFGVVSRGPDQELRCDHGGIDTRVDHYADWIYGKLDEEPPADAGPVEDDAGPVEDDGGAIDGDAGIDRGDGGVGADDDGDGAGCGCQSGGTGGGAGGLVLALGVALLLRRRR